MKLCIKQNFSTKGKHWILIFIKLNVNNQEKVETAESFINFDPPKYLPQLYTEYTLEHEPNEIQKFYAWI